MSIHMAALLRCLTLLPTAFGDCLFLKHKLKFLNWIAVLLVAIGSTLGIVTDPDFEIEGLFWLIFSIFFHCSYVLVSKSLVSSEGVYTLTAVLWNNLNSFLVTCAFIFFAEKHFSIMQPIKSFFEPSDKWQTSSLMIIFSALIQICLNYITLALLDHVSSTTFMIVGVLKMIIQSLISFRFWNEKASNWNMFSIALGVCGIFIHTFSNMKDNNQNHFDEGKNPYCTLLTEN